MNQDATEKLTENTSIDLSQIDAEALSVLAGNDRGTYTIPSAGLFPFQWNWDSTIIAQAQALEDEGRAFIECETLIKSQWPSGMIPHIIFHDDSTDYFPGPSFWGGGKMMPVTTAISQPPIAASCLLDILQRSSNQATALDRIKPMVKKLMAWHRWWHEARDPDGTGMVCILHPWESGRDNSVDWDRSMAAINPTIDTKQYRRDLSHVDGEQRPTHDFYDRAMTIVEVGKSVGWSDDLFWSESPFRVCDVGVLSVLIRADKDLLLLAGQLGFDKEVEQLGEWIKRSTAALSQLWDEEVLAYRSIDMLTGEFVPSLGSASFLPLYAGAVDQKKADLLSKLFDKVVGQCDFAIPSIFPDVAGFEPNNYWRGPTWPFLNKIIADGFSQYGKSREAERLRLDTKKLIVQEGFREYYHCNSGRGLGGADFSWTAASWLTWARA